MFIFLVETQDQRNQEYKLALIFSSSFYMAML